MRPAPIQPPLSCSHALKLASDSRADGDGRRPPASSARHGVVRLRLRRQPGPACTTRGRPGLGAQSLWIPQYRINLCFRASGPSLFHAPGATESVCSRRPKVVAEAEAYPDCRSIQTTFPLPSMPCVVRLLDRSKQRSPLGAVRNVTSHAGEWRRAQFPTSSSETNPPPPPPPPGPPIAH